MGKKQNPEVKGNPWLVEPLGNDIYRVPSASKERRVYVVDLGGGSCNCEAHKPCWHREAAELRARLDVTVANCRQRYAQMRLADLMAEDERLRALLVEDDSHSLRAQYGVLGDMIAILFSDDQAAA